MALITWTDNLSVNVNEIDEQHKKLVMMINELNEAMQQGKGKDIIGNILIGLADCTGEHFSTEEKYFDQFKYPDSLVHTQEHQEFVERVGDFIKEFDAGKTMLSVQVMGFLKEWLVNHIQGSDKEYSPYFNQHGLNYY
jgi:hemerythrin